MAPLQRSHFSDTGPGGRGVCVWSRPESCSAVVVKDGVRTNLCSQISNMKSVKCRDYGYNIKS